MKGSRFEVRVSRIGVGRTLEPVSLVSNQGIVHCV